MIYGLHTSTKGDIAGTPARAEVMGAEAIQIFAGSPRTFKQPTYTREAGQQFVQSCADAAMPAFAHMMYLTAYGTPDKEMRQKSVDATRQTMFNAETLGLKGVVTHMGSHKGLGIDADGCSGAIINNRD